MRRWLRYSFVFCGFMFALGTVRSAEPVSPHPKDPRVIDATLPDLSEFKTTESAVKSRISRAAPDDDVQPGYLGVNVEVDSQSRLIVGSVEPDSPAGKAGLQAGDELRLVAGQVIKSLDVFRDCVQSKSAGETLDLAVQRKDLYLNLTVTMAATSRPLSLLTKRALLGIRVGEAKDGVKIETITPGMPAATSGLKEGDIIIKLDGTPVDNQQKLTSTMSEKRPGDFVAVVVKREGKEIEVKTKLAGEVINQAPPTTWDTRGLTVWKKDVYHLAVIRIEYPDVKHAPQISGQDWADALFSKASYLNKNATGQQVYGSMNDYYIEQSCGKFHVEGKVFDPVLVSKKRADYANDLNRFALLNEALDKLLARDGAKALDGLDGIFFMYSGNRFQTNRGALYWPHRATMRYKGKNWAYFICPEGSSRMDTISVLTHEFGHMLGMPDLYARPESPGSEGLGIWCTMAVGHGNNGRPLHFSAWCKDQLGWLTPTVIDPTVKQKLILAPVENSPKECFKIMIRPDGSEYLLLENRAKRNFDVDLPAEGLLIWRVVDGRPVLEESHGIAGPQGPDRFLQSIPYPSKSNNAFTPYTTPSSKSLKGGGLPVHITNIRRLPDGRVTFYVGYEYL
jgi:M6 family metalloprotease-like protein